MLINVLTTFMQNSEIKDVGVMFHFNGSRPYCVNLWSVNRTRFHRSSVSLDMPNAVLSFLIEADIKEKEISDFTSCLYTVKSEELIKFLELYKKCFNVPLWTETPQSYIISIDKNILSELIKELDKKVIYDKINK